MKIVFGLLGVVAILGILYGLAFLGIIPVQKMAAKNPALAKTLAKMHLASAKPKAAAKSIALPRSDSPPTDTSAQKQQLASERAQLEKDKQAFEAEKQQAVPTAPSAAPPAGNAPPAPDTNAKLSAIYATMSPEDIAKIFAKLPDPVVIQNLMPLDEKKAGQVLATMPADRAARLTRQMMAAPHPPAAPQPATSLP